MYHSMNRWIITLLALVFALGMQAQEVEYTKEDSALVVKLLKKAKTERGEENRIMYFGKKFLGLTYMAQTLEQGDKEHLIVNVHGLDCTTFIETVVAFALCDRENQSTFEDFCNNLRKIRYRNGEITDFTSRLHYFTWWAENNERFGIVEDIAPKSEPWGVFSAVRTINITLMSAHPTRYEQLKKYPEMVPTLKQYEEEVNGKTFRYIPKKDLSLNQNTSLGVIKDGDIIAMVTKSGELDIAHLGIACWENGALHLLHSSSLYKKVLLSKETFYSYETKQPRHMGIRVFRFKD